ncbi:MAG: glutamate mutase L, partial [bacterium]|nr:glutamate mutase L [bacterium]
VPFDIDEADLRDRIKNKMIRPTTIPQMLEELQIEQAIAREALRLAFIQHRALAVGLKGVQTERTLSDVFDQDASGESLIQMRDLDLLVGSGGGFISRAAAHTNGRHADRRLPARSDHPPGRRQHFHDAASRRTVFGECRGRHPGI